MRGPNANGFASQWNIGLRFRLRGLGTILQYPCKFVVSLLSLNVPIGTIYQWIAK